MAGGGCPASRWCVRAKIAVFGGVPCDNAECHACRLPLCHHDDFGWVEPGPAALSQDQLLKKLHRRHQAGPQLPRFCGSPLVGPSILGSFATWHLDLRSEAKRGGLASHRVNLWGLPATFVAVVFGGIGDTLVDLTPLSQLGEEGVRVREPRRDGEVGEGRNGT